MFDSLKKLFSAAANGNTFIIKAPVSGEAVPLSEVPDPTFSEELLGKGAAIIPTDGRVLSPVDGKVLGIFRTCHAVTLKAEDGAEILIHIGLDTVKLDGEYYTPHVKKGDMVTVGQLLIEFDLEAVKSAGYNTITPVLVCNTEEFKAIEGKLGTVKAGDPLITLTPA
ncbi:MAG: PTS glucose transporter subunit IIA [Angelakisella sp.]